jgi:predicted Zn-dependent protease
MKSAHSFLFLVMLLFGLACATSPLGRRQLTILPDSQMNEMGRQSFEELKQKTKIEKDPKINAYVNCVVKPIIAEFNSDLAPEEWEIVVFKSKDVNAFALPGGKIGVFTGIIPILKTDAQLAAVMGHEVGHVIARHGNERVSEGLGAQAAMVIADLLLGKSDPEQKRWVLAGLGLGLQFGVLLPFSRTHESEADLIGLRSMSKAGFDPHEAVEVWKNMSVLHGDRSPPEFASTHPSDQTRILQIQEHLPESIALWKEAQKQGKRPHCALN